MAYFSSTEASSIANPPVRVTGGFADYNPTSTALSTDVPGSKQGGNLWFYNSTNSSTQAMDTDFFTDALDLGIKPGDAMYGIYYSSAASSIVTYFGGFSGVSTSGASLSTGGTMTSTFA
jgi:hypothetical protein